MYEKGNKILYVRLWELTIGLYSPVFFLHLEEVGVEVIEDSLIDTMRNQAMVTGSSVFVYF